MKLSRREWCVMAGSALGSAVVGACIPGISDPPPRGTPRLSARPRDVAMTSTSGRIDIAEPGLEAVLYVPQSVLALESAPLMIFLHGAFRTVDGFADAFIPDAEANKVIMLFPYSTSGTWDAIRLDYFGPDIVRLDAALNWVFERWKVDPTRLALSGFSDGATYTLALGRANGDLFSRLVAFSPGYIIPVSAVGRPPILITHGRQDNVLSYAHTSQSIVPDLQRAGYDVDFRSFDGPHAVLGSAAREVLGELGSATS